jgi:hypothetical protein
LHNLHLCSQCRACNCSIGTVCADTILGDGTFSPASCILASCILTAFVHSYTLARDVPVLSDQLPCAVNRPRGVGSIHNTNTNQAASPTQPQYPGDGSGGRRCGQSAVGGLLTLQDHGWLQL